MINKQQIKQRVKEGIQLVKVDNKQWGEFIKKKERRDKIEQEIKEGIAIIIVTMLSMIEI